MSSVNAKWHKWANVRFLVIIAIIILLLVFLFIAKNEIDKTLLSEKVIEKQFQISLIANQADHFLQTSSDWDDDRENYVNSILTSVEMLDSTYMTYAALFDENLENLSARSPSYEGSPFEPVEYEEFVEAVKANESGDLILPFTPPGSKERDMYLHFHWMPSDTSLDNRVMAVVAISKYSVNSHLSTVIQILAIALIIIAIVVAYFVWRKQMTDSLNRTLEQTVQQRTAELEEQTLSAKKASSAKSDFLSNMSHEIRTPMNAIIGMTSIAKNTEDPMRKDYCLNKIEDASSHLLNVINDILDMSKIEANKFELSYEQFDFEKLLQKVANVIVYRVDVKHQNFTVHIDNDIPNSLIGDDQRITQIITNLLSNAVKFTPEKGSIQLKACLQEMNKDICTIKISVKDSGIGISPEQQAKLFSSFVQAENSTTRKYGGTGLGLAISKSIIEMMGGEIWIESKIGEGSTFSFTIKAERVRETSAGIVTSGTNWSNMSVLVVDDDQDSRDYFAEIMNHFNSPCDVAASGPEAIEMIAKHGPYDFYFVDWKMEGMDGIELARHINSTDHNNSVVIMISASEWVEIEKPAKGAGIEKFLSKPIFPSNVTDCINECLGVQNAIPVKNAESYRGIFRGKNILLVEDVEVNREIVVTLLEPTEINIDQAENGHFAYELFSNNPSKYDLILMDVQMPELDGYDATKKIRAIDNRDAQEIPIIAMTANVFMEDIDKCIDCGMNDHLGKPINYEKMISLLCEYLITN